ncbi:serine/threonine-protein kinase PLK4 [Neocloeon triangulifer]|uniref:serine/threonine-protein kinase PLK4 n=1 Tax=Neocloeon triangulifer TaxID=2078957 RepID=UPI00286EDA8D|nr:serine/threonine-protein kinase PLK4 [Neocloeon triangulifer]
MAPSGSSFGECIQDYEVLNLLGKGGFASVYRARCKKTGQDVAVKMIDKKLMKAAGMVDRVRQEVKIHSRLKHPSVLELFTFFEDENYVYLVLELCLGGELQRYVKTLSKPLPEEQVSSIIRQVTQGLLYLHSHRILHRDLTLANLLITSELNVKIADFGLATQLQRPEDKHMTMCGTPNYISPEVVTRAAHGLEADVWGLGCMLYTLLVGRPPFDTDAIKSTLTRVVMADYKIPDHVSPEARELIQRLLKKNPKERMKLHDVLDHPFLRKSLVEDHDNEKWLAEDSGLCTMTSRTERPGSSMSSSHHMLHSTARQNISQPIPSQFSPVRHIHGTNLSENQLKPMMWGSSCGVEMTPMPNTQPLCNHQHSFAQERSCCSSQPQFCSNAPQKFYGTQNVDSRPCISHALSEPAQNFRGDNASLHHSAHGCCQSQMASFCSQVSGCRVNEMANPCLQQSQWSLECQPRSADLPESCNEQADFPSAKVPNETRRSLPGPLNTTRLQPVRHQTKNAVLSILESGEITVEFLRRNSSGTDKVIDVCRISGDGLRIVLYRPNKGKGVEVGTQPVSFPPSGAEHIFSYDNLPEKHFTKYIYALRFVDLVKAVTPKVTYFSEKAKCMLMENQPVPNYEAIFYNGQKVVRTLGIWKIMEKDGSSSVIHVDESEKLSPSQQIVWNNAYQCLKHCELLEMHLRDISTNGMKCFPVIIGKRPLPSNALLGNKENTNVITPPSKPHLSMLESNFINTPLSKCSQLSNQKSSQSVRTAYIPGVGIANQLSSGEVLVQYSDGSTLTVDSSKGTTCFVSSAKEEQLFENRENLPVWLQVKLTSFPSVIQHLLSSKNISTCSLNNS